MINRGAGIMGVVMCLLWTIGLSGIAIYEIRTSGPYNLAAGVGFFVAAGVFGLSGLVAALYGMGKLQ